MQPALSATTQESADFRHEAQQQEEYEARNQGDTFELPYGFWLDGLFHDMEDEDDED